MYCIKTQGKVYGINNETSELGFYRPIVDQFKILAFEAVNDAISFYIGDREDIFQDPDSGRIYEIDILKKHCRFKAAIELLLTHDDNDIIKI